MLRVEHQRLVKAARLQGRRSLAPQEVQEVAGDRVVIGLGLDPAAVVRPVIPVEQHRTEAGYQAVGNLARRTRVVILCLKQNRAKGRIAAAQDIHRVCRGGKFLQHRSQPHRQSTQGLEFLLVLIELGETGQTAVEQQIGHLLESGMLGQGNHIVTTVVEVVTSTPDRTDGGIAGNHAR